jgi:ribosomal protein S18 acetylase RimI-like enzyme
MEVLLADARAAGCREAWVLTDRSNEPAIRLYEASGGQETPGDHLMFSFPLRGSGGQVRRRDRIRTSKHRI